MWVPGRRRTTSTILPAVLDGEPQQQGAVGDGHVVGQRPLAGPHGAGHDLGHAGVALQPGHVDRAVVLDPDLRHQARDGGQGDPGLAQRGQDLFDVAEEERVRPDHQHALALEREAVGVEEVGGPVQGHRGLAGARAALDHQHPGQRGPDDLVLFPLDGRDDVGHPAGPGPVEGGQQGGRAADGQVAQDELARALAVGVPSGAAAGSDRVRGPGALKRSSSRPTTRRPSRARWRRRTRPWGSRPVAR